MNMHATHCSPNKANDDRMRQSLLFRLPVCRRREIGPDKGPVYNVCVLIKTRRRRERIYWWRWRLCHLPWPRCFYAPPQSLLLIALVQYCKLPLSEHSLWRLWGLPIPPISKRNCVRYSDLRLETRLPLSCCLKQIFRLQWCPATTAALYRLWWFGKPV